MSFVKYPKNWRANGYGWHNQEILNNISQNAGVAVPNQTKTQYPQQQNNQQYQPPQVPNHGPAPAYGFPNIYPSIPVLPNGL